MYTKEELPTHTAYYVNDFFIGFDQLDSIKPHLPKGVTEKHDGKFYPVVFYGDPGWDIHEHKPFVDPYSCHRWWQEQTINILAQVSAHHNFSKEYSEPIAWLLRTQREKLEEDLKEGRETT
ncbi:MAG: hypothetical protein ACQEXI_01045 [Pseudomonadota bacterium]